MHSGPHAVPSRAPCQHAGASGSAHRLGPTGGAANGMFLYEYTAPSSEPRTAPYAVCKMPGPGGTSLLHPASTSAPASALASLEASFSIGGAALSGVEASAGAGGMGVGSLPHAKAPARLPKTASKAA